MREQLFHVGRLQIENPLRLGDLINSQNATLARTEEVIALDRLELSRVKPFACGFQVKPRLSPRFTDWVKTLRVTPHLWLDSAELDSFGTTCLLSHAFTDSGDNPFHKPINSPLGACTVLCLGTCVTEAAARIRREVLGPLLVRTYGATDLSALTMREIIKDLALSEGSLNRIALPHYCQSEWEGILLRIDWPNVARVLDYLSVEEPSDDSIPSVITLGGLIQCVYAAGHSEVRIAICPEHCAPMAIDSLSRWLRETKSGDRARERHVLTTTS